MDYVVNNLGHNSGMTCAEAWGYVQMYVSGGCPEGLADQCPVTCGICPPEGNILKLLRTKMPPHVKSAIFWNTHISIMNLILVVTFALLCWILESHRSRYFTKPFVFHNF